LTKDEALKLALEALNSGADVKIGRVVWTEYDSCLISDAITAIKEALAQPAQEPVAWMHEWEDGERVPQLHPSDDRLNDPPTSVRPLVYGDTTPPQRPWVGLTQQEENEIWKSSRGVQETITKTQAKLKEKNFD